MKRQVRLSESDKTRILQAVEAAEKQTSGEIVPVIVQASATYSLVTWVAASLLGLLFPLAWLAYSHVHAHQTWQAGAYELGADSMLAAQLLGMVLGLLLTRIPSVKRWLVTRRAMQQAVSQKAKALFLEQGVANTIDRTGVLIVISMFERRVEILADAGIHQRVPEGFWNEEVKTLVSFIHRGQFTDGLCQIISDIGGKLTEQFPRRADDVNELPNAAVELP